MRRITTVLSAVMIVFMAMGAAAQEKPDFSGRWSVPAAPPPPGRGDGPPGTAGSGWGPLISIVQGAGTLTVERVFFVPGDLQPVMKFRYALDGAETKNTVLMGRGFQEQISKTDWEGARLVITTVHSFSDPEDGRPMTTEVTQSLWLEQPTYLVRPPSLVVETTISGVLGGAASTTRTIYTRS